MSATATDRYDLPLTTESHAAADHYVEGLDRFLAQVYGPELAFGQAIETDDGLAIAHAADALLTMYRNDMPGAKQKIARAKTLAVNATRRERQHVDAIDLMIQGDNVKALRLIREHLAEFPRDMLMVRLANRLLILGCSGAGIPNFPGELLAMLKTLKPDYGDDWAFLGQYAFAHHETGYYDDSLKFAQHSLDLRPDNANASHSVAHVFFETGDPDGGSDFLGDWLDGYDRRGPFNVHLSWHQALFQLATGRPENAVTLYEDHIRPTVIKKNIGSLADSASLMWRMKIYGDGQAGPWDEVLEIARPAAEKPGPSVQRRPRRTRIRRRRIHLRDGPHDRRSRRPRRRRKRTRHRGHASPVKRNRRIRSRSLRRCRRPPRRTRRPSPTTRRQSRPARGLRRHHSRVLHPRRTIRQGPGPPPHPPKAPNVG